MAQTDFQYQRDAADYAAVETRLDIRHGFLILLISTLPIIPMPPAGGTPILVGVMVAIYLALMTFPARSAHLDRIDMLYVYLGMTLMIWEALGLAFHVSGNDALFVMGRGLWVLLAIAVIMAMNALYARAGMRPVTWILVLSLLALLTAMVIEIRFFPSKIIGRNLGYFVIPFPRATGVPNSDGKLGTFLSICLCYALFLRPPMPRWQWLVLVAGPYVGLAILQSRSTLVALAIITAIYFLYALMRSRSIFSAFFKLAGLLLIVGAFLYNFLWLLNILIGQGIFYENVFGRFELYEFALKLIPEGPLFGLGADAVAQHGESGDIHNTFLAMALKSGVPAGLLSGVTVFAPMILFVRSKKMAVFTTAMCLAMFAEHFFYPGRINEFQIVAFIVAKLAWQDQIFAAQQES